jgi:stage II sporulation protein D
LPAGSADFEQELIRIAIVKGSESIRLDGNGILVADDAGDPIRVTLPAEVRSAKSGVLLNGRMFRGIRASAPVFVSINGKSYRGVVEISQQGKGLLVVNELPLEDYLVGLINCEISSQWPMEAIKAQAVIARSYAIFQKESRKNSLYHLESTVLDQVYDGSDIEDSRASRGVKETAGEVLTYSGAVIQSFYHSNCGGHTEKAENVWGYALPYLTGVSCRYCQTSNPSRWEQRIPLKKLESQLKGNGVNISGLRDVKPGSRNRSGRLDGVVLVTSGGKVALSAVQLRKAAGYSTVKSTNFEVRLSGDDVLFTGTGYGHGVGLCQWGAKQRAADGFDYREILSYYYPGVRLMNLSGE